MNKKFLSIFILSSFLFSCSSNITEPILVEQNQSTKIQSNSGRDTFYKFLIEHSFRLDDDNQDNQISLNEYLGHRPVVDDYWNRNFSSIDENKDQFLSKEEIDNKQTLYLRNQISKDSMRKQFKNQFEELDLDKSAGLTKEEFSKGLTSSIDKSMSILMFKLSDKNKDSKLSFSEYEDFGFALSEYSTENNIYSPIK